MVVYGGTQAVLGTHDVWSLSLAGAPVWTHVEPQGTPPPDRYSALTIYDAVRHRMVVFGGGHASSGEPFSTLDDVWGLSLDTNPVWTQILPAGTHPASRYYHYEGGIYDPTHDRMIVFGGTTYPGGSLNDLWALNLSGPPTWTPLSPLGGPPTARSFHSAIYDAANSRMVLYAGVNGSPLGDVWALALDDPPTWSAIVPSGTAPAPRSAHSAIYDPVRDRMVVFGRSDAGDLDCWSLSLTGAPAWSTLEPANTALPRAGAVTILDDDRGRIVTFGGSVTGGAGNDTWVLPLPGLQGWSALAPSGTPPPVRSASAGVYDGARSRLLIFGGSTSVPDDAVWSLAFSPSPQWSVLPATGTPPSPRSGHTMVYDGRRDRVLLFGGGNHNDVWSLSLADDPAVWQLLAPAGTPPPPASSHTAHYDVDRDRMLVFRRAGSAIDAWELSLAPLQWRHLVPTGTAPPGRDKFSTAFDSNRDHILLCAGVTSTDPPNPTLVPMNDVWAFDLSGADGAWSRLVVTGNEMPPIFAHRAVYDRLHDRMIVAGGRTGSSGGLASATWELQLQGLLSAPPSAPSSLLVAAQPNPSSREFGVSFTLASREPARIDIFDAAGRRLVSRDVGSLGVGTHVLRLGVGRPISPGVYLLRLTQERESPQPRRP